MNNTINVAFSTDSNYIMPTTVAITSFLENNNADNIYIHLLHLKGDLSTDDLNSIRDLVISYGSKFVPLEIEKEALSAMPLLRHGLASYLRIFLPQILDVETILYLDVDIIVDKNILELFELDMNGYEFAAVPDIRTLDKEYLNKIGFNRLGKYFCTGILLMNLNELRKIDLVDKTYTYLSKYKDKIEHSDQDILNVICNKILYLHPKYNRTDAYFNKTKFLNIWTEKDYKETMNSPYIIHYMGSSKPWYYKDFHSCKIKWYKYLKKTKYKAFRPNDKNFKNFLISRYWMIRRFLRLNN